MNSFETLRKIIDNNVTNRVDHVAFRLLGKTYTNQFLAEESKRIEALLHASLTSPVTSSGQIRVGVCLGRNQYFLPAFYTLLRNGYTYIPLDPDLPEDRMNYIIEDSQMNLILTTPDLVHKFKTCQTRFSGHTGNIHQFCPCTNHDFFALYSYYLKIFSQF